LNRQLTVLPDPLPHNFAAVERKAVGDALAAYAKKMREGYRLTAIESYRREEDAANFIRMAVMYGLTPDCRPEFLCGVAGKMFVDQVSIESGQ